MQLDPPEFLSAVLFKCTLMINFGAYIQSGNSVIYRLHGIGARLLVITFQTQRKRIYFEWVVFFPDWLAAVRYDWLEGTFVSRLWLDPCRRFMEALTDCFAAINIDHSYLRAFQRRADVFLALGDYASAGQDLKIVLANGSGRQMETRAMLMEVQRKSNAVLPIDAYR